MLTILLSGMGLCLIASAQNTIGDAASGQSENTVRIIEPKKDVEVAKAAAIDDERFELGGFTGVLAVEDFNANLAWGLSLTYHISTRFVAQVNYGVSDIEKATLEGDNNFLSDSDREFIYTNFLAGYKILPGRSFLGKSTKYNSDIYLLGGLGRIEFAGDTNTSFVFGTSYRVVFTDALTGNLDFRGHMVDRDFLDDDKTTFNPELVFGLNILF